MKLTKTYAQWLTTFYSYKRPHMSASEWDFITAYIMPEVNKRPDLAYVDVVGNIHIDLRTSEDNRTLFVAHTDSVHHTSGRQKVKIDSKGMLMLDTPKQLNKHKTSHKQTPLTKTSLLSDRHTCLGADDASGVLILLHMIQHNVPAYYIFTRGEERGGIGSRYIAEHDYELLWQFDRAVAFDRRGTYSIITHQAYGRTCSDDFAYALADCLTDDDLMYSPDQTGVYTDTAEFLDCIPECTNVSVGYANEHTERETQDVHHLLRLMDKVLTVPWDSLPTSRDVLTYEDEDPQEQAFKSAFAYDWYDRDDHFH